MDQILLPIALLLGIVGFTAGVFALWGWFLLRRQILGESPSIGKAVAHLQQSVVDVNSTHADLARQLREIKSGAVQHVDVKSYALPGAASPSSALVALRDNSGNGVLIHVFGSPQIRVMPIQHGKLVPPAGSVMPAESQFLAEIQ